MNVRRTRLANGPNGAGVWAIRQAWMSEGQMGRVLVRYDNPVSRGTRKASWLSTAVLATDS